MIGEMLVEILGQATLGRIGHSRRAQVLLRLFFGLLGAVLSAGGAVYFLFRRDIAISVPFRAATVAMFGFFGCFWLFNVALARTWRWPAVMFAVSFVMLFVTRIVYGP